MAAGGFAGSASRHVQPLPRRDTHDRHLGSGHRPAVLPDPQTQAGREYLSFLKTLGTRWPGQRLYVITDNYSPHKHPEVRSWAADNDVELMFLPTYGSWLNWIESEFAALRYYRTASEWLQSL
ncbi:transposase [Streptomyces sp. Ag109_O5-1]|uniref:transposase n=1 Tax=Streptomyces sp. Ag109_O5-1 TaxID=1938851 RepID=UPI001C8485D9|nr:transposase [Streptomyces sp. Ag109_O5-1]